MVSPANPADRDDNLDEVGFDDFDEALDSADPGGPGADPSSESYDDLDDLDDAGLDDFDVEEENIPANPAKAARKKSSLLTIMIVVAAVLIGGFILFKMFAGNPDQTIAAVAPAPDTAAAIPPDQREAPAATADAGGLAGLQTLDQQQAQQAGTQPAVQANQLDAATSASPGFMNDPAQLAATTAPAKTSAQDLPVPDANGQTANDQAASNGLQNLPTINQIKKADTPQPAATAPAVVNDTAQTPAFSAREQELQSRLDGALTRLQAVEQKLAQVSNTMPATESSSTGAQTEISALRADLERLSSKVDNLNSAPVSAKRVNSDMTGKRAPPRAQKAKVSKSANITNSSAKSAVWQLRSAQPGQALVAKPDGNDLKLIRIGDSVAGIGQVTDISKVNGRWQVQGTSGQISEKTAE